MVSTIIHKNQGQMLRQNVPDFVPFMSIIKIIVGLSIQIVCKKTAYVNNKNKHLYTNLLNFFDYFLSRNYHLQFIKKIKRPRVVRIVKRRAGFCWYYYIQFLRKSQYFSWVVVNLKNISFNIYIMFITSALSNIY